jgi:hypothetical protein
VAKGSFAIERANVPRTQNASASILHKSNLRVRAWEWPRAARSCASCTF